MPRHELPPRGCLRKVPLSSDKPGISVFFPAYFDQDNIGKVTESAVKVLEELGADYEVIIIEDGSPDRTGEVADELARRFPRVKVIHHPVNMGYGTTLKDGFLSASKELVFYTDGDNQFDLTDLKKFYDLARYTDIVAGFRIEKQYSPYRKVTSFVYNLILRALFDIPDRDVDCAFKLFPRRLFDEISIDSKDAFIDAEIMIKARKLGYTITTIGVHHYPRVDGVSTGARPSVILRTIGEIYQYWKIFRNDKK